MICDKTKESCVHILILHDRTFILVLETRRMVGRGRPLLPEILGQSDPVAAKTPIFNRYGHPVLHFWPKLSHPAARSVCDS